MCPLPPQPKSRGTARLVTTVCLERSGHELRSIDILGALSLWLRAMWMDIQSSSPGTKYADVDGYYNCALKVLLLKTRISSDGPATKRQAERNDKKRDSQRPRYIESVW